MINFEGKRSNFQGGRSMVIFNGLGSRVNFEGCGSIIIFERKRFNFQGGG